MTFPLGSTEKREETWHFIMGKLAAARRSRQAGRVCFTALRLRACKTLARRRRDRSRLAARSCDVTVVQAIMDTHTTKAHDSLSPAPSLLHSSSTFNPSEPYSSLSILPAHHIHRNGHSSL